MSFEKPWRNSIIALFLDKSFICLLLFMSCGGFGRGADTLLGVERGKAGSERQQTYLKINTGTLQVDLAPNLTVVEKL